MVTCPSTSQFIINRLDEVVAAIIGFGTLVAVAIFVVIFVVVASIALVAVVISIVATISFVVIAVIVAAIVALFVVVANAGIRLVLVRHFRILLFFGLI